MGERERELKRDFPTNDNCLCVWWMLQDTIWLSERIHAHVQQSCDCAGTSVPAWKHLCVRSLVIASTAICLSSIWQLQEITGLLQERGVCVSAVCSVHVHYRCVEEEFQTFSKVRQQVEMFFVALALCCILNETVTLKWLLLGSSIGEKVKNCGPLYKHRKTALPISMFSCHYQCIVPLTMSLL